MQFAKYENTPQNLIFEKVNVDIRLYALKEYQDSPEYDALSLNERHWITRQIEAMEDLLAALNERLALLE